MSSLESNHLHTNALINETSPYLLQHAHNPVNWYAWNEKTLEHARREGKMLIISVGYSACHWCHVMEKESFEDEEVAKLMNDHFICVKVDREERPDIDQVYMHAVQLLSGRGGWPLNCFALPDGRPFYGGTYFSKEQWMQLLQKIVNEYAKDSATFIGYAERLTAGVQQNEFELNGSPDQGITGQQLHSMVENWKTTFDNTKGGANHAPKFPIPNNYQFLLRYGYLLEDEAVLNHVTLTLQKMANGGIYDQLGGGFARYAIDMDWKVPHFEKMLYDNAQLVSLYAEAYQHQPNERYKTVVYQTVEFIKNEMTNKEGAFYSALDADSEGEEGKYYVWTKEELMHILGEDFEWAKEWYHIDNKGLWEHGNYILLRTENTERLRKKEEITAEEMRSREKRVREKLLNVRANRIRPGLDDKTLTSWNAMMIKGLVDAFRVFHETSFLNMAVKNAMFIRSKQLKPDGSLFHNYKNGRSTINAYLEDYAFVIDAFISLYQVTFDEEWLENAKQLSEYALLHFYDEQSQLFYFTSDQDPKLIARKMEVRDNVIPASNSTMAHNLFLLGHYFDQPKYLNISNAMLNRVATEMPTYGSSFSNWAILALHQIQPFYEVAFVGKAAKDRKAEWDQYYVPNCLAIGTVRESKLPLLEHKLINGQTTVYVCENKTCQLPVRAVSEALKQLKRH